LDFEISLFIFFMNLTTLELDTLYFYFIKLGHFIPTAPSSHSSFQLLAWVGGPPSEPPPTPLKSLTHHSKFG